MSESCVCLRRAEAAQRHTAAAAHTKFPLTSSLEGMTPNVDVESKKKHMFQVNTSYLRRQASSHNKSNFAARIESVTFKSEK